MPGGRVLVVVAGLAVAGVGVFRFLGAAWTRHSEESTGLDGALRVLQGVPLGRYELVVTSVGLMYFGVYLMTRARHLRR
jgi:uncharacterized membrane protein HdeD (DUF308 family)